MHVRVVGAAEAAARDAAAISAGTPSRALMQRAGAAAAGEIARRYADRLAGGVAVFAGPGNNGGDAAVVARALAVSGVPVRLSAAADPRTEDARFEREQLRLAAPDLGVPEGDEAVVVDGLLGTGSAGAPRGAVADAVGRINAAGARGAAVVALDVPSGVDATTGRAEGAVAAALTLTFGTVKRGLLVARELAGEIAVLDIGLGAHAELDDGAPRLVDARYVRARVPRIGADAHKGVRRRLAVLGGGAGMVGATILAARAAYRSGVGLVRLHVAGESVPVVQTTAPEAIARPWPEADDELGELSQWAHAVLVGPGLGRSERTRRLVERLLAAWQGPVVVDADALNVFEGEAAELGRMLSGREALLTPHPTELARLTGRTPDEVLDARFEAGGELAREVGAAVLLKGVPTVVSAASGERLVIASGTPVLAVGGSGDLLAGIAGTLLAQTGDALASGACAAWIHGRAAELAGAGRPVRGVTLDEVTAQIGAAWGAAPPAPVYPVLATLPPVGDPRR